MVPDILEVLLSQYNFTYVFDVFPPQAVWGEPQYQTKYRNSKVPKFCQDFADKFCGQNSEILLKQ